VLDRRMRGPTLYSETSGNLQTRSVADKTLISEKQLLLTSVQKMLTSRH
jgi:hypothetical protein